MQAVAEVARVAGDIALRAYRTGLSVEIKSDGSPVTVADRAAESAAREWIGARFPADGILGEEHGEVRPDAARRWIIDPIDGTKSFVRGVPLWGTLIAVCEGEHVLAGAVYLPAADGELIAAGRGCGAWHGGVRCRVSDTARISDATVLTTDPLFAHRPDRRDAWERVSADAAVSRSWGDCYGYVLVATGRADVMVDAALAPWDAAALMPVIEEAGGVFTSWEGVPTAFGRSAVATNTALATAVRARLAKAVRPEHLQHGR